MGKCFNGIFLGLIGLNRDVNLIHTVKYMKSSGNQWPKSVFDVCWRSLGLTIMQSLKPLAEKRLKWKEVKHCDS